MTGHEWAGDALMDGQANTLGWVLPPGCPNAGLAGLVADPPPVDKWQGVVPGAGLVLKMTDTEAEAREFVESFIIRREEHYRKFPPGPRQMRLTL